MPCVRILVKIAKTFWEIYNEFGALSKYNQVVIQNKSDEKPVPCSYLLIKGIMLPPPSNLACILVRVLVKAPIYFGYHLSLFSLTLSMTQYSPGMYLGKHKWQLGGATVWLFLKKDKKRGPTPTRDTLASSVHTTILTLQSKYVGL